jgi:dihydrofolate reductase
VRQVLELGLLDELDLHVAPVLLGDGMRLFDGALGLDALEGFELVPSRVAHTSTVTHVRYTVAGRAPLVLDDRGRGGGATQLTT